jgi:hypothetical protein
MLKRITEAGNKNNNRKIDSYFFAITQRELTPKRLECRGYKMFCPLTYNICIKTVHLSSPGFS